MYGANEFMRLFRIGQESQQQRKETPEQWWLLSTYSPPTEANGNAGQKTFVLKERDGIRSQILFAMRCQRQSKVTIEIFIHKLHG